MGGKINFLVFFLCFPSLVMQVRDQLADCCKPKDIKALLEANSLSAEGKASAAWLLHRAADGLAFGRIGPCPTCKSDGKRRLSRKIDTTTDSCSSSGSQLEGVRVLRPHFQLYALQLSRRSSGHSPLQVCHSEGSSERFVVCFGGFFLS